MISCWVLLSVLQAFKEPASFKLHDEYFIWLLHLDELIWFGFFSQVPLHKEHRQCIIKHQMFKISVYWGDKAFQTFLGFKKKERKQFLSLSQSSDWKCGEVSDYRTTILTVNKDFKSRYLCFWAVFHRWCRDCCVIKVGFYLKGSLN